MKFKYLSFIATIIAIIVATSCEKEPGLTEKNKLSQTGITVPFFELAKGDTISKDIYRDKPEFTGAEDVTILYSTESTLKSSGEAVNPSGYPLCGMKLYVKGAAWVPESCIPVDLNEGAGGKWIYLECTFNKITDPRDTKRGKGYNYLDVEFRSVVATVWNQSSFWYVQKDGTNIPGDCNDGAGGDYVYIKTSPGMQPSDPGLPAQGPYIRQIMVASSSSSSLSFDGWTKIDKDLNKKCGGKYIYLFYKKY